MARGYFRTDDTICVFCGYTDTIFDDDGNYIKREKMPYKIGKGVNKTYLCKRCFNNTKESKEEDIEKYKNG